MIKNTFAIVCEWPTINAAENETIFRIKIAAGLVKKNVLVIDKYGSVLDHNLQPTSELIKSQEVDFIINLHFASPKYYDGFSYVALWNPIRFYHDWDYKRYSFNLVTHHDFISCLSEPVNDHAARIAHINKTKHLNPDMVLSHTNSGPYYQFNNHKDGVFYCGINWDKSVGKKSRFAEIFEDLDKKNILKIYGPRKLSDGTIPWGGFKSYVDEIPFDGVSTFKEISKCLLGLALSHEAHIESAIASSRVFELIAGGTLPICDENPFFQKYFGEKVLYVSGSGKEKAEQIVHHYNWALQNKDKVEQMVNVLQDLMKLNFDLAKQLEVLYDKHQTRRELVEKQYCALENKFKVNVIYIHQAQDSEGNEDDFCNLITSIKSQNYSNINLIIASGCQTLTSINRLDEAGINYEIFKHNISEYSKIGLILEKIKNQLPKLDNQLFIITNRYEQLFYDHISSLARCFEDAENYQVVESNCVLVNHKINYGPYMNNLKDFYATEHNFVFGSVMFRTFPADFILRYLDWANYRQSMRSFFEGFYVKTNRTSIKINIKNDLYANNDGYLSKSLLIDYSPTMDQVFPNHLVVSKDFAYQILSRIKIFTPITKIREMMMKRRVKRKKKKQDNQK